ncbi:protein FD-like [Olea europaea var. sylvestris]|uniref:protein FD-like n=1 Tax=Olea europaea var. sylvestris TaxID=158386 RepID=UPI000C1D45BB|nr:protein FD-like [Olea europaea var. sylvestris]
MCATLMGGLPHTPEQKRCRPPSYALPVGLRAVHIAGFLVKTCQDYIGDENRSAEASHIDARLLYHSDKTIHRDSDNHFPYISRSTTNAESSVGVLNSLHKYFRTCPFPTAVRNEVLNPRSRVMEEVWNDINLASLNDHPTDFRGMNLQDFLARTCPNKDSVHISSVSSGFASPTTMLTLNSRPEWLHFSGNSDPLNLSSSSLPQSLSISPACRVNVASEGHWKKRFTEPGSNLAGDRRYKRMIKNRESASRSRTRKQESLFLSLLLSAVWLTFSGDYYDQHVTLC